MYTLTDKGELELRRLADEKDPIPETVKDEFMLKAYFISALTQEEADELFTDQLVKRKEKLSDLENSYQELMTSSAEADSFSSLISAIISC